MKLLILFVFLLSMNLTFSQEQDSTAMYKKRVLETTEVDFLNSYYNQKGIHSSVSGGMGSEQLSDFASNIIVSAPLNDDDVLTINTGISAYTSASSSNINPFNATGASGGNSDDDDDDDDEHGQQKNTTPYGTPWQASSGASKSDQLVSLIANYSHSADDRNTIYTGNVSASNEYDYTSVGFGGSLSKLFNQKNTEVGLKLNAYIDQWRPIYPTELHEYSKYKGNFLSNGFFNGVNVIDQNGQNTSAYLPNKFTDWETNGRNSYSATLTFSQILNKRTQVSVFVDLVTQQGMLSTPYHRIYFKDKANYYIGEAQYISGYENDKNGRVYQLADDIERLPNVRLKLPIGARLNYYVNEWVILRSYYRYYWDDWKIQSHTVNFELPIKISQRYTVFPIYRYYMQSQTMYFAPYEQHVSTEKYYTSDYDLSTFKAHQYGFGISYTDIFTGAKIWKFGLKNMDFRYNHYNRSDGLKANIVSFGIKFVMQ